MSPRILACCIASLLLIAAPARAVIGLKRPELTRVYGAVQEEARSVYGDQFEDLLFLARSAILVEGRTEKLVLPAVFAAFGHDADRAEVSIVECGGKSNIPVFARICQACRIPFVVVHDRDAESHRLDPGAKHLLGLHRHAEQAGHQCCRRDETGHRDPPCLARARRPIVPPPDDIAGPGQNTPSRTGTHLPIVPRV